MSAPRSGPATIAIGGIVGVRADSTRFLRGMELVDRNLVTISEVGPGTATAVVFGTRAEPYRTAMYLRELGRLPDEPTKLTFSCTCPDWGDPCKHAVGLAMVLAAQLDESADLLTRFLGLAPEEQPRTTSAARVTGDGRRSLPSDEPLWASYSRRSDRVRNAAELFGSPRQHGALKVLRTGQQTPGRATGIAMIDALGPLLVDGFDLAPTIRAQLAP
jgi:hypothetical protein